MKAHFFNTPAFNCLSSTPTESGTLAAERDFTTPDGRLVPRAIGEAALQQHTALLVGGMLIGYWPDNI